MADREPVMAAEVLAEAMDRLTHDALVTGLAEDCTDALLALHPDGVVVLPGGELRGLEPMGTVSADHDGWPRYSGTSAISDDLSHYVDAEVYRLSPLTQEPKHD